MNRVPYLVLVRWALLAVVVLGLMLVAIWLALGRPTMVVIGWRS